MRFKEERWITTWRGRDWRMEEEEGVGEGGEAEEEEEK